MIGQRCQRGGRHVSRGAFSKRRRDSSLFLPYEYTVGGNMNSLAPAVPSRIVQLVASFSHPEPIRRGSLYERRMKCGQEGCACQHDPKAAHGPYFTLTQKVDGKTHSRYISPEQAPVVRRQIESGRQFRERVEAYWEACERWADEQLEAIPVSAAEAEKGGSPRTWKARSPRKSKRS